jgi:RimJ/RimL family protein N-acetyltransferase
MLKETDQTYIDLQNTCFENCFEILPKNDLRAAVLLAKKLWPIYAALGFYRLTISCSEPEGFKSLAGRLTRYLKEFIKINIAKISFKKFVQQDLALFFAWTKKPHVKNTWFINGYESIDKYSEKIKGNGYDYSFIIYIDDKPIGYIQCSDLYAYKTLCPNPKGIFINEEPGIFCLDLFIGEEEYLNKGYGTKIVKLFVGKLFAEFKAKKILIDPACSNKRAIRCYEKAGFKFLRKEHDGVTESCIMEFTSNKP